MLLNSVAASFCTAGFSGTSASPIASFTSPSNSPRNPSYLPGSFPRTPLHTNKSAARCTSLSAAVDGITGSSTGFAATDFARIS